MFSTTVIMIHKETSFNVKPTKILIVFGGRGLPAWATLTHRCEHSFIQIHCTTLAYQQPKTFENIIWLEIVSLN